MPRAPAAAAGAGPRPRPRPARAAPRSRRRRDGPADAPPRPGASPGRSARPAPVDRGQPTPPRCAPAAPGSPPPQPAVDRGELLVAVDQRRPRSRRRPARAPSQRPRAASVRPCGDGSISRPSSSRHSSAARPGPATAFPAAARLADAARSVHEQHPPGGDPTGQGLGKAQRSSARRPTNPSRRALSMTSPKLVAVTSSVSTPVPGTRQHHPGTTVPTEYHQTDRGHRAAARPATHPGSRSPAGPAAR